MSDSRWRIDATVELPNGTAAAAFLFEFYGSPSLFVATRTAGRWGRPRLVQPEVQRFITVALRHLGSNRLRAEFANRSWAGMTLSPVPPVPDAIEFNLADVEMDSDGDGWTDLEEDWLGMNRGSADSDRDGLPDGSDSTPTLEANRGQADPDDAVILQRALFAMFGLTGAPHAVFVRDQSPRLHINDLPGPVFYRDARAGVRVTWKVISRSDTEAIVQITDYEAPLAASGNEVRLRRIRGDWYVVDIRMLWIS